MQEEEHTRTVRIHIDEHRYESPNPTTGAALYQLGHIAASLDLTVRLRVTTKIKWWRRAWKPFISLKMNTFTAAHPKFGKSRLS